MYVLAQVDIDRKLINDGLDELQDFGQSYINVEGMLVMTLFLFAVTGVLFMIYKILTRNKPAASNEDNDAATTVALAVVKAAMQEIANPLNELVSALKKNAETESNHREQEITQGEAAKTVLEELTTAVISHNNTASAVIPTISEIATNTKAIKEQVNTMTQDIGDIKPQIDQILSGVNQLLDRMTGEVSLDTESLNTVREFVKVVKALEKILPETEAQTTKLETPTVEAPKVETSKPKPKEANNG